MSRYFFKKTLLLEGIFYSTLFPLAICGNNYNIKIHIERLVISEKESFPFPISATTQRERAYSSRSRQRIECWQQYYRKLRNRIEVSSPFSANRHLRLFRRVCRLYYGTDRHSPHGAIWNCSKRSTRRITGVAIWKWSIASNGIRCRLFRGRHSTGRSERIFNVHIKN